MINSTMLPLAFTPDEAIRMQEDLHHRLVLSWDNRPVTTIGGVAIREVEDLVVAAISVQRYPDLTSVETVIGEAPPAFPYIPGLWVYRVGPAVLDAWQKLAHKPDLLLVQAHGTAHPRGMGLASHLGIWLGLPTIGVARTLLYGCESSVDGNVGDWSTLLDEHNSKKIIGAVLRTCDIAKPVYVSPGHLIDLKKSIDFVLACCHGYRLPEPIRSARQAVAAHK